MGITSGIQTSEVILLIKSLFRELFSPVTLSPFPHHKMLRKAMVGMTVVGLSVADAYSIIQKRDGAHAHEHAHEPAPADVYAEPAASYGEPAPSYGAEEAALPDLTPIIIGILALV